MTVGALSGVDGREAGQVLARSAGVWVPLARAAVEDLAEPLRRMTGYHLGWWDVDGNAVDALAGKGFRAGLALCSAEAAGGGPGVARSAAVGVELLHNFTLVHDDLMDRDRLRRGRATVWSIWGDGAAVLVGDALHALAIRVLTEHRSSAAGAMIARLADAALELCRGQSEDLAFETTDRPVGVADYVQMVAGKTGSLMGAACALGALAAAADAPVIAGLEGFGRELGLAFQFADDVLGVWGDPAVTGKPAGSDLARRKRTLPVVAALASGTAAAGELDRLYRSASALDPAQVARAKALVEAAGVRDWCRRQAVERIAAAWAALPAQLRTTDLWALARFGGQRWQ
ncbi:polyprenyl synthetase family protein [Nocardia brasiliensis]|uniref:polyprenyl synthetase family protein n=1 Tax=Nocardia brasiliensis TaxID=37326 RepID=UPI002454A8D5|nr:polyprenyl synthetase family protein [Nocardia brasiliensis]